MDYYYEKKENLPLLQKIGINLSKITPHFILNKITNNVCANWNKGGKEHILNYIKQYDVNWKECKKCFNVKTVQECAKKFKTKNEFFQREFHPSVIDIHKKDQLNALVSPADCRIVFYKNVDKSKKYWIKGRNFTTAKLLNSNKLAERFNGPIAICRLTPQDYHRFHFPIDCTYVKGYKIDGNYNSVDKRIVNSSIDTLGENKREVHFIYNRYFGYIAYVIIGAACIGSIETDVEKYKKYKKGDYFGKFGFGGSTIVLLFEKNLSILPILLQNSKNSIETYVRVGNYLGEIKI